MVMQLKNYDPNKLRIYFDFRGLKQFTIIEAFSTPFSNKIINEVTGHEFYSFTNGFSGYNQVPIEKED
jgi:hypothetical protein